MEDRPAPYQFTKEEAIEFARERRWELLSPKERGLLQLRQDRLCMDFSAFHEGATALLGRPIYTHEFAAPDDLWAEYLSGEPISFADVLAKLPDMTKVVVINVGDDQ
jgi:hypothetical protein